ncbi:MAG: FAD-binding protein [Bacteroidota bacterium]
MPNPTNVPSTQKFAHTVPDIPGYKGKLSVDIKERGEMADDFGHTIHNLPILRAIPSDAEDISLLVKWAAAQNPPIRCAARGIGHSAFGQAQIYSGVAIDMAKISHAKVADDKKSITVGCGASWEVVIQSAAQHDLRVPVTTANPFLTVGGSMSLAGMDYTSSTVGAAVDHLLELKVVTGEGEIVVCSQDRNKDLFDAVRCGFGEYGIMVEATFPLLQPPSSVISYWLVYEDFDQAFEDMVTTHANPLINGCVLEVIPRVSPWLLGLDLNIQFKVRTDRCLFPFVPSVRGKFLYLLTLIVYVEEGKDIKQKDILRNLHPARRFWIPGVWNNRKDHQSYVDWKKFLDKALELARKQCLITQPNIVLSIFLRENEQAKAALKKVIEQLKPNSIRRHVTNFAISDYTRSAFNAPGFLAPTDTENFIMFNIISSVPKATPDESRFDNALNVFQQFDDLWYMVEKITVPPGENLTGYAWGYQPISWPQYYGKFWDRQVKWKEQFDPNNILGGINMFG